jgi:hypothetical protein
VIQAAQPSRTNSGSPHHLCGDFAAPNGRAQGDEDVHVRSGINHKEHDRLLKKYVNEQELVNYGAWKQNAADLSALDEYGN